MKRLLILFVSALLVQACNNEKKTDEAASKKEEAKEAPMPTVTLPYKTEYTDFKMGSPEYSKLVLDFYKMWEDNKLSDGKSLLADSVGVSFADGSKFSGSADSLIKMGNQFRAMYSSSKFTIDACMSVHYNDKNEDWVLVWDREYNTDKKGKLDSAGGHAYWKIVNNKIAYWGEQQQKLTPPPAKK